MNGCLNIWNSVKLAPTDVNSMLKVANKAPLRAAKKIRQE